MGDVIDFAEGMDEEDVEIMDAAMYALHALNAAINQHLQLWRNVVADQCHEQGFQPNKTRRILAMMTDWIETLKAELDRGENT